MADIALTDLTNSTDTTTGTGVFDLLITAVERQIDAQYDAGRITGTDYATVYLGGLQAVLQQSVAFLMQEQEAGIKADTIEFERQSKIALTKVELEKQWGYDVTIDLATGVISALTDNVGEPGIVDQQRLELEEKIDLIQSQDLEVIADTVRKDSLNAAQVDGAIGQTAEAYAKVALLDQQQISELAKTTDATGGTIKAQQDKIIAENLTEAEKTLLVTAQTLGFKSDTKQKLLKLMLDGYAVNQSIINSVDPPEATKDSAIDQLTQEILDEQEGTSVVVIQSIAEVPDTGAGDDPPG